MGLALALLDDERYAEISGRLRSEGFKPDTNKNGNPTLQRWRLGNLKVTIDFLIPPAAAQDSALRVHNLEPDFGTLVTPGLELAFDERVHIEIDGCTLKGERARRTIPVSGPAAFVVLKALAFGDRGEPKDAYDLVYVIRHTPGRGTAIAEGLRLHAQRHPAIVARALGLLRRDFSSPDAIGSRRTAAFAVRNERQRSHVTQHAADHRRRSGCPRIDTSTAGALATPALFRVVAWLPSRNGGTRRDRCDWQADAVDESPVTASAVSPQGRRVELTEERWRYIQRHVEMRERRDTLLEAIRHPDFQEPDPHPGRERYWLRCRAPFPFRWLRAVVEFAGDADRFVTAFGQDNDPEGLPR